VLLHLFIFVRPQPRTHYCGTLSKLPTFPSMLYGPAVTPVFIRSFAGNPFRHRGRKFMGFLHEITRKHNPCSLRRMSVRLLRRRFHSFRPLATTPSLFYPPYATLAPLSNFLHVLSARFRSTDRFWNLTAQFYYGINLYVRVVMRPDRKYRNYREIWESRATYISANYENEIKSKGISNFSYYIVNAISSV